MCWIGVFVLSKKKPLEFSSTEIAQPPTFKAEQKALSKVSNDITKQHTLNKQAFYELFIDSISKSKK